MSGAGPWLLKAVQFYAWAVFVVAWVQMGWADWTQQKIRNRYLTLWLKFILGGYALLAAQTALGRLGVFPVYLLAGYFLALGGYVAVSMASAYALWGLRIWPAGDVKLFSLLALYFPLMRIPGSFHSGLRCLEVLINVFVPAAAFLFVTASEYLWRTRFNEQKKFYVELGVHKGIAYLAGKFAEAAAVVKAELVKTAQGYRENPRQLLRDAGSWLSSMVVMSMVSYYLGDVLRSNFLKTVFCFILFFSWSRFCQTIGKYRALGLMFVVFGVLIARNPHIDWVMLSQIFGHISIFSFCIFLGVQLAMKIVAGQAGFVFMPLVFVIPSLLMPLLFALPSLLPWSRLKSFIPHMTLNWAALAPSAGLAADLAGIGVWAVMGLFFGLSLVFVKIWDAESYKSVSPSMIEPYMTLGPAIVERIEADEEFRDEHFSTFYADGLTPDQAQVLAQWCQTNAIASVPLAPTISFANWIFLGYLLTLLLDGHVLRMVY
ncbi:MAG: hypothetical protein HY077_16800 [Elusimicrobia bacterium]|nr:hypothetical protein [Elusimicrobiota bacterium]